MYRIAAFLLLSFALFVSGCLREPTPYQSRFAKTSGDNGFKIRISGDPEKYVPGEVYTGMYCKILIIFEKMLLYIMIILPSFSYGLEKLRKCTTLQTIYFKC